MDLAILKQLKGSKISAEALRETIASAIENKNLAPGEKLPSTRDIALYLGISRTTVMKSLDNLIATGHLTTSPGAGTWVRKFEGNGSSESAQSTHEQATGYPWKDRYSSLAINLDAQRIEAIESTDFDEINFGSAPNDMLPLVAWKKSMLHWSHNADSVNFEANSDAFGYSPLREAIAGFLRRTKQIICKPEQIVIGSGVQSVVSPAFSLLVKPDDAIVCENPGFWGAREQFHSLGAAVLPVGVDEHGLMVDLLDEIDRPVQWVYVAPSCQEPSGVMLSEKRRGHLLDWCRRNNCAILEDDWDSEFQYDGQAAPSLFSLDKTGSVVYFYSFWRLLYPLVSVSFLVIPEQLIELFQSYKCSWDRQFTLVEHLVLTELLDKNVIETHMRSMWKTLRKRRQTLIFSLKKVFKDEVRISSSTSGMHVVLQFKNDLPESDILIAARKAGLSCASTAPFYAHSAKANEFMLRFSSHCEDEIESRINEFAIALNTNHRAQ
jgi:GntR family transcriptional regulator/MocR family aminotransferase